MKIAVRLKRGSVYRISRHRSPLVYARALPPPPGYAVLWFVDHSRKKAADLRTCGVLPEQAQYRLPEHPASLCALERTQTKFRWDDPVTYQFGLRSPVVGNDGVDQSPENVPSGSAPEVGRLVDNDILHRASGRATTRRLMLRLPSVERNRLPGSLEFCYNTPSPLLRKKVRVGLPGGR